jgi:predicted amidohydrolase YtcJ
VIDAAGGQVLPGLHDHHIHLRALAAAGGSVAAGPPDVTTRTELVAALARADRDLPPGAWLRAVGYHESVAGDIDRSYLDAVVPNRPARVQHRSGILWILNSAGLAVLDAAGSDRPGIERDARSIPTGRLWREDGWLRHRLPPRRVDLAPVSRAAAAAGITGFTDATPHDDPESLATLSAAAAEGTIVQRLHLMSALGIDSPTGGPVKFLLDDDRLPTLDDLTARISAAHHAGRPVAVHCVTRVQAVVTLAALRSAGSHPGDRVEHGAVIGPSMFGELRSLGLTVVTQPGFVRTRGDRYLQDVDRADQPDLWRLRSLVAAGVAVAGGTDAPFGPADPWVAIETAADRRTGTGRPLGGAERVPIADAVALFSGRPDAPAITRLVRPGQPADLCLLAGPLPAVPPVPPVVATIVAGRVVYRAG